MASWAHSAAGEDQTQTTETGNAMMWDDQRCRLRRVAEASQPIWGTSPRGMARWHVSTRRGAMP